MSTTTKELLIDSGFFIALLHKDDQYHVKAKKVIKSLPNKQWVTTWHVLTEVAHMLVREKAHSAIQTMLQFCENGGLTIFHIEPNHIHRLKHVMGKYQDLPIDLADGSLIILAEELGHGEIVSTDLRDFAAYRWKNTKPFKNYFNH